MQVDFVRLPQMASVRLSFIQVGSNRSVSDALFRTFPQSFFPPSKLQTDNPTLCLYQVALPRSLFSFLGQTSCCIREKKKHPADCEMSPLKQQPAPVHLSDSILVVIDPSVFDGTLLHPGGCVAPTNTGHHGSTRAGEERR